MFNAPTKMTNILCKLILAYCSSIVLIWSQFSICHQTVKLAMKHALNSRFDLFCNMMGEKRNNASMEEFYSNSMKLCVMLLWFVIKDCDVKCNNTTLILNWKCVLFEGSICLGHIGTVQVKEACCPT